MTSQSACRCGDASGDAAEVWAEVPSAPGALEVVLQRVGGTETRSGRSVSLQQLLELGSSVVPEGDAKLAGFRGCSVHALLAGEAPWLLGSPARPLRGICTAGDGMTTEPIPWEHLQQAIVLHSEASGQALSSGGPLRLWIPPEAGLVCHKGSNISVKDARRLTFVVPVGITVVRKGTKDGVEQQSAKVLSLEQLLSSSRSTVPESDDKFAGFTGCSLSVILEDVASGSGICIAGDGMTTEPVPLEYLQRSILMHSDAQGDPLQSGGPLRLWIPPEAGLICKQGNNISVKDVQRIVLTTTVAL